ncbi:ribonuclease HII [Thermobrachium celere]|uniref:Ribonuclease HII n=1 Tax=Thermobrachium celere DSM 8682 TaxID=941824 RepID=R7RP02_9CLOT|nr:ribonuclease HII [Thermobrachium celere]CDF57927.1 Ribonuclease HII [Thermobrachium celere DSM 8682]
MKIKELEELIKNASFEEFEKIKNQYYDLNNKSLVKLFDRYEKKIKKELLLIEEYEKRTEYERSLLEKGYKFIAGVDEVGRGPLAGPVYAAAVILDLKKPIYEIKDSKKLSHNKRKELSEKIKQNCIAYSIAYATEKEIDELNILNATKLAMKRAIESLKIKPDYVLIDAVSLDIDIEYSSIIKGDDVSASIGAASIIAKVERDEFMDSIAKKYTLYGFEKNKGYGTKDHIEAIKLYGPCEIHRRSFLKNIL